MIPFRGLEMAFHASGKPLIYRQKWSLIILFDLSWDVHTRIDNVLAFPIYKYDLMFV